MQENIEGAINYGQSRETGNIDEEKQNKIQHTMCWTLPYPSNHKQSKEDINRFWPFCL